MKKVSFLALLFCFGLFVVFNINSQEKLNTVTSKEEFEVIIPEAVKSFSLGITPLMYVAKLGDLKMVEKLIANGADIEEKDANNWTALMHACDHLEIVEYLVSKGATINAKSIEHATALDIAEAWDSNNVYAFLEKKGAKHCKREKYYDDENYDITYCYEW